MTTTHPSVAPARRLSRPLRRLAYAYGFAVALTQTGFGPVDANSAALGLVTLVALLRQSRLHAGARQSWLQATAAVVWVAAALALSSPSDGVQFLVVWGSAALVAFWFDRDVLGVGRYLGLGLANAATLSALIALSRGETGLGQGRWEGISGHPNHLGLTAAFGVMLIIVTWGWDNRRSAVAVNLASTVLGVVAAAGSGSRSALVVLLVPATLSVIRRALGRSRSGVRRRTVRVLAIAALAFGALSAVGIASLLGVERLLGSDVGNELSRVERLELAWDEVSASPIVPDPSVAVGISHNVPLELWRNGGLPGLAAGLVIVVGAVVLAIRSVLQISDSARSLAMMTLSGIAVSSLTFAQLLDVYLAATVMSLVALLTRRRSA